jgi:hypothetical protein
VSGICRGIPKIEINNNFSIPNINVGVASLDSGIGRISINSITNITSINLNNITNNNNNKVNINTVNNKSNTTNITNIPTPTSTTTTIPTSTINSNKAIASAKLPANCI